MPTNTFAELYASLLKNDVYTTQAQGNLAQGADALTCALAYAEQGKPDFTLAYLLLAAISDAEKREILAVSYEQRAKLSEEKAEQFDQQFHRPFPLIKLEAQKDRLAAQQVARARHDVHGRDAAGLRLLHADVARVDRVEDAHVRLDWRAAVAARAAADVAVRVDEPRHDDLARRVVAETGGRDLGPLALLGANPLVAVESLAEQMPVSSAKIFAKAVEAAHVTAVLRRPPT